MWKILTNHVKTIYKRKEILERVNKCERQVFIVLFLSANWKKRTNKNLIPEYALHDFKE